MVFVDFVGGGRIAHTNRPVRGLPLLLRHRLVRDRIGRVGVLAALDIEAHQFAPLDLGSYRSAHLAVSRGKVAEPLKLAHVVFERQERPGFGLDLNLSDAASHLDIF